MMHCLAGFAIGDAKDQAAMMLPRWIAVCGLTLLWLGATSLNAADWAMPGADAARSHTTTETLAPSLSLAWRYQAAQPASPAWPDPVKNLNRLDFDYAAQPIVAGGLVYIGSSADDTLRAFDAGTGQPRWRVTVGGPIRFSPQVVGDRLYLVADDGFLHCLDAKTGAVVWRFRASPSDEMMLGNGRMISRWACRSGVLVDSGVVYVVGGMWATEGVFIWALNAQTGEVIWCNDTSGFIPTRVVGHAVVESLAGLCPQGLMVASKDRLVLPIGRGGPAVLDRRTGQLLAYQPGATNGVGGGWLTVDGDYVYALGQSFYTPVNIGALAIDTLDLDAKQRLRLRYEQMPGQVIPQNTLFVPAWGYSVHQGQVRFIVKDSTLTMRLANGMIRAGESLVLGLDDTVRVERAAARPAAIIRAAVCGEDLAISMRAFDGAVTRNIEKPWAGSCFEIFAATPGKPEVGQVFLVPGIDGAATALKSVAGKPAAATEIRARGWDSEGGYRLAALVPLRTLGIDPAADAVDLEFQITTQKEAGKPNRNTLFGTPQPYTNRDKFPRLAIKHDVNGERELSRLAAAGDVNTLPESLAKRPEWVIKVADQAEAWRAPVTGKAYGLAVADGRLFVSTDRGELSCFAPEVKGEAKRIDERKTAESQVGESGVAWQPFTKAVRERGMNAGYAMVLGPDAGGAAAEFVRGTSLRVVWAVKDEAEASKAREQLIRETGCYGTRVQVVSVGAWNRLPLPRYFASVVAVTGNVEGLASAELYRVLRPLGGMLAVRGYKPAELDAFVKASGARADELRADGEAAVVRGRLAGAWDWDSKETGDTLVKWPLRPIWFGGTGPDRTHNRKWQAGTLTASNGIVFENGESHIIAVDAYNGAEWWTKPKPFQAYAEKYGTSLSARGDSVYYLLTPHMFGDRGRGVVELDAKTGAQRKVWAPWKAGEVVTLDGPREWPLRWDGRAPTGNAAGPNDSIGVVSMSSDAEGLTLKLRAKPAPILGRPLEWNIYLDLREPRERFGMYEDKTWRYRVAQQGGDGDELGDKYASRPPMAFSAQASTGPEIAIDARLRWADVPFLRGKPPASFGFSTAVVRRDPKTADVERASLFGDLHADWVNNGWASVALDKSIVPELAKRPAIVVGLAEDKAPDAGGDPGLELNEPVNPALLASRGQDLSMALAGTTRKHPLTGQLVEKFWIRGDGCSQGAYSASSIMMRAANVGIYDFADDSGLRTFTGVRASCGVSSIAALGVWYIANGGSGCECTYPFLSQVALATADRRLNEDWAVFPEWEVDTVVRRARLNLGAAGDRRDADGELWLAAPRPPGHKSSTVGLRGAWSPVHGVWQKTDVDMAMRLPLDLDLAPGGGPVRVNSDRVAVAGTSQPWLYGSHVSGVRKAIIHLNFIKPLAAREAKAIKIDGQLDDDAWKQPPHVVTDATKSTIWFAYDKENLYIAARRPTAFDRQGKERNWNTTPGGAFHSKDHWEIFLSDASDKKVMHLGINASGDRWKGIAVDMSPEVTNVKLPASSEATCGKDGFVAEFAVQWATIQAEGLDPATLGVNVRIGDHPLVGEALVRLGAMSMSRCQNFVPLGRGSLPAVSARRYTLRLHFAEIGGAREGERVFGVRVQGREVFPALDVVKDAGGARQALIKTLDHVEAGDDLTIEFAPAAGSKLPPMISALELEEER